VNGPVSATWKTGIGCADCDGDDERLQTLTILTGTISAAGFSGRGIIAAVDRSGASHIGRLMIQNGSITATASASGAGIGQSIVENLMIMTGKIDAQSHLCAVIGTRGMDHYGARNL
jgi:hypothetical protein